MTDTRLVVVASGPQGPPGTVGLLDAETWNIATKYHKGSLVVWSGVLYVSSANTLGEQPDTHPLVWEPLDIETHEGAQAKATAALNAAETFAAGVVSTEAAERTDADNALHDADNVLHAYVDSSVLDEATKRTAADVREAAERVAGDAAVGLTIHTLSSTGVHLIGGVPTLLTLAALDLDTLMPIPAPLVAPANGATAIIVNPMTVGIGLEVISRTPLVASTLLGAPYGIATLDVNGQLTAIQVPPVALVQYLGDVSSQAAMLALVGQPGDWCVRTDLNPNQAFMLKGADPSILANWNALGFAGVNTVAGRTGDIVLVEADIAGLVAHLAAKASTTYVDTADASTLATATGRALGFAMTMGA